MITFQPIINSSDPLFMKVYELYRFAFPPSERRNLGGFEYVLNYDKRFELSAIKEKEEFCGFLTYWTFGRFCYLEHFAIEPSFRGKNIGSDVMKNFLAQTKLPVVLEVEMPDNVDAMRRIRFYEKAGFNILSHHYAQPFYDGSGNILPMLIMSNGYHFADKHFKLIKDTLYKEVYHYSKEDKN